MKSKVAGIYCITSKVNGKKYVGQSVNIGQRWGEHIKRLKANKHHSQHLQNHFNKYSIEDLIFEVLEEATDLTLLTNREQHYIDLLKPEFNSCPAAGSCLGLKHIEAKYYTYNKKDQQYKTFYSVSGIKVVFGWHKSLDEALKEIEYLKTLNNEQLIEYKQKCLDKPKKRPTNCKNYGYHKQSNTFRVTFKVGDKYKQFGSYATEQEAIDRVIEVRNKLGIE
jgi:group I intron endonuclease